MGPRAGLDGWGKFSPLTGIRSPDRPTRSESQYRLSYPGPLNDEDVMLIIIIIIIIIIIQRFKINKENQTLDKLQYKGHYSHLNIKTENALRPVIIRL